MNRKWQEPSTLQVFSANPKRNDYIRHGQGKRNFQFALDAVNASQCADTLPQFNNGSLLSQHGKCYHTKTYSNVSHDLLCGGHDTDNQNERSVTGGIATWNQQLLDSSRAYETLFKCSQLPVDEDLCVPNIGTSDEKRKKPYAGRTKKRKATNRADTVPGNQKKRKTAKKATTAGTPHA